MTPFALALVWSSVAVSPPLPGLASGALPGSSCADVAIALGSAAADLPPGPDLWTVAQLSGRGVYAVLDDRLRRSEGSEALAVAVAMGLGRRSVALKRLSTWSPPASDAEARLGRALGLLALGDATATPTVAAAFERVPQASRRMAAGALARMVANRPRSFSYRLLDDRDPGVQVAVAEPHLRRGSRRARSALLQALEGPNLALAARAGKILLDAGHGFSTSQLERLPAGLRRRAAAERSRSPKPLLTSPDPELRAGAFAAALADIGLRPRELDAAASRNRRRDPVRAEAELAMARLLAGTGGAEPLYELTAEGASAAAAVVSAYAASQAAPPGPAALDGIETALELWTEMKALDAAGEAAVIEALSTLAPLRALDIARARVAAEPLEVARAAVEALGRGGRSPDLPLLLARAGTPSLRVAALQAAVRICAR